MPFSQLHKTSLQPDSPGHEPKGRSPAHEYSIRRKGSRYNIIGPAGREFTKYKSASVAGPRWEELTGTPWPYESSAYEPGTRLWQLGDLSPENVGTSDKLPQPSLDASHANTPVQPPPVSPLSPAVQEGRTRQQHLFSAETHARESHPAPEPVRAAEPTAKQQTVPAARESEPAGEKRAKPVGLKRAAKPVWPSANPKAKRKTSRQPARLTRSEPVVAREAAQPAPEAEERTFVPEESTPKTSWVESTPSAAAIDGVMAGPASPLMLALPAPRLDLAVHERRITALRRNPGLLFDADTRQALRDEVEYHRPYARWAQYLLSLLAKYERRQQRVRMRQAQMQKKQVDSQAILAKHLAWQEDRVAVAAVR